MIGVTLGEWIVEAELGRGSWGTVYRVRHQIDPERKMAIKLVTDPRAKDAAFHLRFQAEMAVLRRLDHPHIVRYYDHGIHEQQPYFVMEYLEGGSFESRFRESQRIPWQEMLALAIQIVAALRYAHRRGILHRSLKPSNLFEFGPGQIKIGDFGLLKLLADSSAPGASSTVLAPIYCTPEQLSGKALSKRSDFYALGTLLYTLIVGRPPFSGAGFVEIVQKICFTLPERAIHYLPDLPEEIDYLISKLLSKEPAHRPGSGTLLLSELERIWSDLERRQKLGKKPELPAQGSDAEVVLDSDTEEEAFDYRPVREPRGRWTQAISLFLALCGVIGILVWAFFFRGESAEVLFARGQALMESTEPEDWERGWDDSLSKLAQKFPDQYATQVKEAKSKVESYRELKPVIALSRRRQYQSEAERFYYEGYRLCQAGNYPAARAKWENLRTLFAESERDKRWLFAAELGLKLVREVKIDENLQAAGQERIRDAIRDCVRKYRELKTNNNPLAKSYLQALESLYEDEPIFEEFRDELRK
jgi:serine/threonine-protein kinase